MKNICRIIIVLLIIGFQVNLLTTHAQTTTSDIKDFIIQGMAYNESLITDIKVEYTKQITQYLSPEIVSERLGSPTGPLPSSGEYIWAMKGRKEYYECKENIPMPDFPQYHAITAFGGERTRGWGSSANTGTIFSDNGKIFDDISSSRPSQFCLMHQWRIPYSQMLNNPATQLLGKEVVDGYTCWVLERKPEEGRNIGIKMWVDSSHGFRPRRIYEYGKPGIMRRRYEDITLTEVTPGIWFSTSGTMYEYWGYDKPVQGEMISKQEMRVTKVNINSGLPDSIFTDIYKPGVKVWDKDLDITYSVE